jgi:hypothetical protein
MGNTQSTPKNHHSRLSKPKTNTNSPPALLVESSESRYADLSAKGRQRIKEGLLSPVDTEHGSAWSTKDGNAVGELAPRQGRPSSIISRSNSRTNSRSNSMSCFGSRQGSTTKLSDANTQVDLEAAIRLLQEVKKNASPEDLAALREYIQSISIYDRERTNVQQTRP